MRYQLERHTDHPTFCWRVVNTETQERVGFGLAEGDADECRRLLQKFYDDSTGQGPTDPC